MSLSVFCCDVRHAGLARTSFHKICSRYILVADSHLLTSMRVEGNFPQQHKFALPAKYGGSSF